MRAPAHPLTQLFSIAFVALISGCGGGGGGGGDKTPAAPSGLSYSAVTARLGSQMTDVLPVVTGAPTSYSVSPALPAGVTLDPTTGRISGTPTAVPATMSFTITATNAGGSTSAAFSLKVFTITPSLTTLTRLSMTGASIYPTIVLKPVNLDVPVMYATAQDPLGYILPAVEVTANADKTFTLRLTTSSSVPPSSLNGSLTLSLCPDAACASRLDVPSIVVPYDFQVLSTTPSWPGDHLTTLTPWNGAPEWSMFQGNAAHTGYVPVTIDPNRITTRWKTPGNPIPSPWAPYKQNLVTANGLFYVVSSGHTDDGAVYARRESDGSEVWTRGFPVTWPSADPVAVSGGVVYLNVGNQSDAWLYALDATSGAEKFRSQIPTQWQHHYAPTIAPNGKIYINGGTYDGMYGFDETGQQLFFASTNFVSNWSAAADSKNIYTYTGDFGIGYLRVFDPLTGTETANITDPTYQNYIYELLGSPVLGAPGSVIVANYANGLSGIGFVGNQLMNFRMGTSSIAWSVPGRFSATPAYRSGVVYVTNNQPFEFEARSEETGEVLWSWTPASGVPFVSEVVVTDNLAFVSTSNATYAIDLTTHLPVFSYPVSGKLALSPSGVLYIQNTTDLIALNVK